MKVIICEVGRTPYVGDIKNNIEVYQRIVKGYIETIRLDKQTILVCNDEGKIRDMKINRPLFNSEGILIDFIYGDFFIVGYDGKEDFTGLTPEQINKWGREFY